MLARELYQVMKEVEHLEKELEGMVPGAPEEVSWSDDLSRRVLKKGGSRPWWMEPKQIDEYGRAVFSPSPPSATLPQNSMPRWALMPCS